MLRRRAERPSARRGVRKHDLTDAAARRRSRAPRHREGRDPARRAPPRGCRRLSDKPKEALSFIREAPIIAMSMRSDDILRVLDDCAVAFTFPALDNEYRKDRRPLGQDASAASARLVSSVPTWRNGRTGLMQGVHLFRAGRRPLRGHERCNARSEGRGRTQCRSSPEGHTMTTASIDPACGRIRGCPPAAAPRRSGRSGSPFAPPHRGAPDPRGCLNQGFVTEDLCRRAARSDRLTQDQPVPMKQAVARP